jgi:hypothetical protein
MDNEGFIEVMHKIKKAKRVVPQPMLVLMPIFYGISTIANKKFGGHDEE